MLEAIAEAVRSTLPVLFVIEDNRYAISTRTAGKTFLSLPSGDADNFYGLPVTALTAPTLSRARPPSSDWSMRYVEHAAQRCA